MALWGSASVSEYLWWTRWSRDQSRMSFWNTKPYISFWLWYSMIIDLTLNYVCTWTYLQSRSVHQCEETAERGTSFVWPVGPKTVGPRCDPKSRKQVVNSNWKKQDTDLNGHLSIRDCTDFLSEGLIFAYLQPHHRINKNQQWHNSITIPLIQ